MSLFVVIIGLLSLVGFLDSFLILRQEFHRLQQLTQPFGGTVGRWATQGFRLMFSFLFTLASVAALLISGALIWLGTLPLPLG